MKTAQKTPQINMLEVRTYAKNELTKIAIKELHKKEIPFCTVITTQIIK